MDGTATDDLYLEAVQDLEVVRAAGEVRPDVALVVVRSWRPKRKLG